MSPISQQLCTAHLQQIIVEDENLHRAEDSQLLFCDFTVYGMTAYREHV
jgi:hypothetical protein